MREHPIIFSTEMVRTILDGRKTMTRRVCKGARELSCALDWPIESCPYGQVGSRLWVRETWDSDCTCDNPKCNGVIYKAGYSGMIIPDKWRPSIFMPRWASRIILEITGIRVERLQDITYEDIGKEGLNFIGPIPINTAYLLTGAKNETELKHILFHEEFGVLWDSLNAKRGYSWESNPFVWVIEFRKL